MSVKSYTIENRKELRLARALKRTSQPRRKPLGEISHEVRLERETKKKSKLIKRKVALAAAIAEANERSS